MRAEQSEKKVEEMSAAEFNERSQERRANYVDPNEFGSTVVFIAIVVTTIAFSIWTTWTKYTLDEGLRLDGTPPVVNKVQGVYDTYFEGDAKTTKK